MRVGIPRALLYYQYYPMWKTFFEELGASVVVSDPTTKATLAAGSERLVAETCLPVKVYCGHVLALVERADVLFVPAVRSLEPQVLNCSKFLGLPDLVRAVVPEAPLLLDPEIDLDGKESEDKPWSPPGLKAMEARARLGFYYDVYRLGRRFTGSLSRIRRAARLAWQAHQRYLAIMQTGLMPEEAIALWETGCRPGAAAYEHCIALVGHPYNLYDTYITQDIMAKLQGLGSQVLTAEMAGPERLRRAVVDLTGYPYWTYEDEIVGAGGYYVQERDIDGVIVVTSFGCGPDSTLVEVVRSAASQAERPFMNLVIDEHTGEAGMVTRLEAFIDMIARRERLYPQRMSTSQS
jgi:predicted nucleotide-binding protein (sugar kinase/HSP70/actin superfamily)